MRKCFLLLLFLASFANSLFAQEMPCDDTICPEGGVRGNIWPNHNLNYYIENSPSNLSSPTSSQCQTAIQNAFSTGSQHTDFTFRRVYSSSQADIILKWETSCNQGYSSSSAVHSSDGKPENGKAFIHFNDLFTFTITSSGYNLQAITLREIGRVLDLEYVSDPYSVMNVGNISVTNLTGHDLHEYYVHYAFPWSLTGSHLICDEEDYNIYNLPFYFSTSWSLTNPYYNTNCLQNSSNYPGRCTIYLSPSQNMIDATLTAIIKMNGVEVHQLYLSRIYAYDDFWGEYSSGDISGNINYTHYFNVRTNTGTTIFSPNFYGATVTYSSSGVTPTGWGFHPDTGILDFTTATPNAAVVINVVDGCGNNYTLYAYATSQYRINVSNGSGDITVTLVSDDDSERGLTLDQSWTIEVRSVTTGQLMATQSSASRSESISTVGWPKGVYVVKVTIGKEELTEKVIVK